MINHTEDSDMAISRTECSDMAISRKLYKFSFNFTTTLDLILWGYFPFG